MNMTRLSIKRPVGISMIVAFFVVLGLYSYYRIGVELLPALNTPYVTVSVKYPGASAESVEQEVVKPVEDALSSVSGVKKITSTARYERARVTLELDFATNADTAAIDASKKVEAIANKLPDEADSPVVIKRDMNAKPIVELAVLSDHSLADTYTETDNVFSEVIQQAGGVSEVELHGGRDREVAIDVDREKMAAYKLTLAKIAAAIKDENQLVPSGSVYTETTKSDVRVVAQFQKPSDIEKVQVENTAGKMIPLTAVATVREREARTERYGRLNGEDAINVLIYKNSDANVVETAANIMKSVEKLRKTYPDYQFVVVSNDADYVRDSLHSTMNTLIEGLITTGLVLFFFLRGWRSTASVIIAIPTSLISTFFVMYMAGFSFNMMSLMGMTLCVGILVDDSIVVLENIHRHLAKGEDAKEAAVTGRMEIGMAAIAITLCDVVVFLPIAFMSSMTGQFFKQFGLTIVFASLFSLFISFTLTPMLASKFFKNGVHVPDTKLWRTVEKIEQRMEDAYGGAIAWSFRHKKKLFGGVAIAFFLFMAMVPLGWIGMEYMPRTDESGFNVKIQLPTDASVERTDAVTTKLESYLAEVPEVKSYMAMVGGGSGVNSGRIRVSLVDRQDRSRDIWSITSEMRTWIDDNITDGDVRIKEDQASVSGTAGGGLGNGGGAFRLELRGNDMADLIRASEMAQQMLKSGAYGVTDVSCTYQEGLPEISLIPDREKLKHYGVTVGSLYDTLSSAISGAGAGVLPNDPQNNGNDTDIHVYFKGGESYRISDLAAIPIKGQTGIIRMSDVAELKDETGPITILRTDKQRAVIIGANPGGQDLNGLIQRFTKDLHQAGLPNSVNFRFSGQADSMRESFIELLSALLMGMLLVYMILSVLYESVKTSFIRMFSLPFGLIGSLLFLFLMNDTINIYSMIGIIVMDGVVAKNGTLLLDYTLTLMHQHGMAAKEAVIAAGRARLRPIFMTTFTMIVGMLPTALALTAGSETRSSMAWVIIGGLITSTLFTLLVIPMIFLFFQREK